MKNKIYYKFQVFYNRVLRAKYRIFTNYYSLKLSFKISILLNIS